MPLHRGTGHIHEALLTASSVLGRADCQDASTDDESDSEKRMCSTIQRHRRTA